MSTNLIRIVTANAFRLKAAEAERYSPLIREAMIKMIAREEGERNPALVSELKIRLLGHLTEDYQRKAALAERVRACSRLVYDTLRRMRDEGLVEQNREDPTQWRLKG